MRLPYRRLIGQTVQVYRNLHRDCLSVRMKVEQTYTDSNGVVRRRKGWKVVAHLPAITIIEPRFKVSEAGRKRVIREGRKNVHAYVEGVVGTLDECRDGQRVYYDPFKFETFVTELEWPIRKAAKANILGKDVYCYPY